jgi:porphobilinogen synthase
MQLCDGFLDLARRPRRLRQSASLRALVQETHLLPSNFIAPLFVTDGPRTQIATLPGVERLPIDALLKEIESCLQLGIKAVNLFCHCTEKDPYASQATLQGTLLQRAIFTIKRELPEIVLIADIALDPFTDHGHDGIVHEGKIMNDVSVEVLSQMVLRAAEAGVDIVAPSDMMDGRVGAFRKVLDAHGFQHVSILSYAAKYASAFYGPFRDVLDTPKFGDKKTYQMNPANGREALLECRLDEEEGADFLLIKPATLNLDIIAKVRARTDLPIAAYHVSGEYAMIKAAAALGWMDEERALLETMLSIKRAGADLIMTYAAKSLAKTCG